MQSMDLLFMDEFKRYNTLLLSMSSDFYYVWFIIDFLHSTCCICKSYLFILFSPFGGQNAHGELLWSVCPQCIVCRASVSIRCVKTLGATYFRSVIMVISLVRMFVAIKSRFACGLCRFKNRSYGQIIEKNM